MVLLFRCYSIQQKKKCITPSTSRPYNFHSVPYEPVVSFFFSQQSPVFVCLIVKKNSINHSPSMTGCEIENQPACASLFLYSKSVFLCVCLCVLFVHFCCPSCLPLQGLDHSPEPSLLWVPEFP